MRLWAANTTKRNLHFHYRIPEMPRLYDVTIPVGAQREIHPSKDGMERPVCDALVRQLQRQFAAIEAGDRPDGYVGVAYSVDKPVAAKVIEETVNKNDEVLTDEGAKLRQDAAIASHVATSKHAEEMGFSPDSLTSTTTTFQEETKPGDEPGIVQEIEVVKDGESGGTRAKPATNKRRRK